MDKNKKCLLYMHIAIALFGSASLFGKLINQPTFVIVAGRVFFSAVAAGIYFKVKRISIKLDNKKDYFGIILMGVILAAHWLAFYNSVKISTVAIALLTFSTCPIFTTFLEPLFFKQRIKAKDILVAIVAFSGVLFVIPKIEPGNAMFLGVVEGIFSGVTFSLLSIMEKKYIAKYKGVIISFYEQAVAFVVILPLIIITGFNPITTKDVTYMLIFSLVFTLFSRALFISGLKGIRAQTASVINSIEPLYGIVLAAVLLGEFPSSKELIGGAIILLAVTYSSLSTLKEKNIVTADVDTPI